MHALVSSTILKPELGSRNLLYIFYIFQLIQMRPKVTLPPLLLILIMAFFKAVSLAHFCFQCACFLIVMISLITVLQKTNSYLSLCYKKQTNKTVLLIVLALSSLSSLNFLKFTEDKSSVLVMFSSFK